jgi:hypothetical protein
LTIIDNGIISKNKFEILGQLLKEEIRYVNSNLPNIHQHCAVPERISRVKISTGEANENQHCAVPERISRVKISTGEANENQH